eukprot:GHVT01081207.1.p1 GENE.GHVT01081207.1~~GHVT01081207.1.p1  ORF type:complete len:465 (+),score=74.83 GHVT01081207.1:592-1986(+)
MKSPRRLRATPKPARKPPKAKSKPSKAKQKKELPLPDSTSSPTDISTESQALSHLQLDVPPEALPCREVEMAQIESFLVNAVKKNSAPDVMYISGIPGTGKTGVVRHVIRRMQSQAASKELPTFTHLMLNAMGLAHPTALFRRLYAHLYNVQGRLPTPAVCYQTLERRFQTRDAKREMLLLVIDEVDCLMDGHQRVLLTLFDWPRSTSSRLAVVTISNTIDLPDKMMARCASRIAVNRLVFRPYNAEQIGMILRHRLLGCESVIADEAIAFCARRVALYAGDIRRALHICKIAILRRSGKCAMATDVNSATVQLFSSPETAAISLLPWLYRAFLAVIITQLRKNMQATSLGILAIAVAFPRIKAKRYKLGDDDPDETLQEIKHIVKELVQLHLVTVEPVALTGMASGPREGVGRTGMAARGCGELDASIDEEGGDMMVALTLCPEELSTALESDPFIADFLTQN